LSRGDLTDAEWQVLNLLLPDRGERGPAVADKRRTVNGILWVLRTGAPWRDMPKRYGNWNSVFVRFTRWRKLGVCLGHTDKPRAACQRRACYRFDDCAGASACSRRKRGNQENQALGRSRGGFSTKVHLRTSAKGEPLAFELTGGEAHEVKGYEALMTLYDTTPERLIGDKGYDSDEIRSDLAGIEPVIPPRSNRTKPIGYDRKAYKRRNLIERCVNRLKQFRRIATRYEKNARAYLSMLGLAATRLWMKTATRSTTLIQLSQWKLYI
jgi:transposase